MILRNMYYNDFLQRFSLMLNSEQQQKLTQARVIVFGVGGVGGSLVHMLVRSGIRHIGILDFDSIDASNINRQLVANQNNIGKLKVDELKKQLLEINPELVIDVYPFKYSEQTQQKVDLKNYDYIADCIDDISAKKLLIKQAKQQNVNILCAMGAGNRFSEIPNFEIADIFKTSYDPIAKILRKFCSAEQINKLQVCYTKQKATKFDCKTVGSVIYYPINMASIMCAKIINDLLK